jgi:pimeloyl-ACP methyl ester carboxylesterase
MTAASVDAPFTPSPVVQVDAPDGARIAVFGVLPPGGGSDGSDGWSPGRGSTSARPPVLLVHGASADHTTFRVVGPLLARSRPVLALDRRGRGASTDGPTYSIEREFEDVGAVADAIGGEPGTVDVVGHSYGGRCALGATLVSDAIRRVVAYEGAPAPSGVTYRPEGLVEAMRAHLASAEPAGALDLFLARVVGMSPEALAAYHAEPVWPARVAAAHTIVREIEAEGSDGASLETLSRVAVPVLLVLGSASRPTFHVATEATAARLPRAEVALVEGAAHAAHHTHPIEFTRLVEAFLDR